MTQPQVVAPPAELADPKRAHRQKKARDKAPPGRFMQEVGWRYIVGLIACVWAIFPILYILSAALNPLGTVVSTSIIPKSFSGDNFSKLFNTPSIPFGRWYVNTLVICFSVTLIQVFFSALAAFAFSRLRFTGRRAGLLSLLLIQMFPQFLASVALYTMFTDIGNSISRVGLNTLLGYIIVLCGNSLGQVWLIKGFFDTLPMTLDEAAKVDGASHAQTFFRIILPLATPILAVCSLLVFVSTIGEFLLASIFLTDTNKKTLATGLYGLIDGDRSNNLGVFAAGALLVAIPVVVLFLFLQRFIVGGITSGGVKG